MNQDILENLLTDDTIDKLLCYDETTSTNDMVKQLALEEFEGVALAVADKQTAGRGRMGRHWESPKGSSISMSLLLQPTKHVEAISSITLLAALAIVKAIQKVVPTLEDVKIKWPNDVILNSKKVSGILTEMVSMGGKNYVIVGIGINVLQDSFPEDIADKASSILIESGSVVEKEDIIVEATKKLTSYYETWQETGSLRDFVDLYNSLLISKDKEVVLSSENIDFPHNPYISRGITKNGALIVEDRFGELHEIATGEVSVRGVLGYV